MSRLHIEHEDYLVERRSSWSDCLAGAALAGIVLLILFALAFVS
ncbi:MAG: hypothetical protein ACR2PA_21295 [Hyphomicrobiaceae bacterium]